MAERTIEANGVELCTESFGDSADSPLLLVMGTGASMLWWEEGFCRILAGGGRFVIRYDHRDTGRSVTYKPGCPGYTGADLVGDAAGVLDADSARDRGLPKSLLTSALLPKFLLRDAGDGSRDGNART